MALSTATIDRLVDCSPVARLAQLDDRNDVQVLPFVFARVGEELWSPIDGKPKTRARLSRLEWISRHPQVCILIDHYAEDWSELWWVKLYCRALEIHEPHPQWEQARGALLTKYPQYNETPLFVGEPTMIRFQIERAKSWGFGGEAAVINWLGERQ